MTVATLTIVASLVTFLTIAYETYGNMGVIGPVVFGTIMAVFYAALGE
jgi:hypothetical protein